MSASKKTAKKRPTATSPAKAVAKRAALSLPEHPSRPASKAKKAAAPKARETAPKGRKKRRPKLERVTKAQVADAQARATATYPKLRAIYPDAHCELDHTGSFQLLVSVVLSAQTTDVLVNKVTPHLFSAYPDARALAAADPIAVGTLLRERGLGMYNNKAKNIVGLAKKLVELHRAEVPRTLAQLVELPGVGRKTANVVLGVAFGTPEGVVVDTHVMRLAQRLGWTRAKEPLEIEQDLMKLFPRAEWDTLSHVLIFHGRRCCFAQRPSCAGCGIREDCPSAFRAETIGRKSIG